MEKTTLDYLCDFLSGKAPKVPQELLANLDAMRLEIRDFFAGAKVLLSQSLDSQFTVDEDKGDATTGHLQSQLIAKAIRQILSGVKDPFKDRKRNRAVVDAARQGLFGSDPLDREEDLFILEKISHELVRLGEMHARQELGQDTLKTVNFARTTVSEPETTPEEILARTEAIAEICEDIPVQGTAVMLFRVAGRTEEEVAFLLDRDLEEIKKHIKIGDDEVMHARGK